MIPTRVFLSGGSGFVGSSVLTELVTRGLNVRALVNRGTVKIESPKVEVVRGDLFDDTALDRAMAGCDAAIHLVGIIMEKPSKDVTFERIHVEGTRRVLEAAKRNGVRRYVHMSALGTRDGARSMYHRTKYQAEQIVQSSGLDWTIIRPSLIHGPGGEFMQMEVGWARGKKAPWVAMPYFGAGLFGQARAGKLQPVYVNDVSRAFVDCLENPKTAGSIYELGGGEAMSWPAMHRLVSQKLLGKERPTVAIPVWYAKLVASLIPGSMLPFNKDQVMMAEEDNVTGQPDKFVQDFGWQPRPMGVALDEYIDKL